LKTLGFTDRAVLGFVLSESVLIMLIGGLVGLGAGWILVQGLAQQLGAFLPGIFLSPGAVLTGVALMVGAGVAAGIFPALTAMRLPIVTALARGWTMLKRILAITWLNLCNLPRRMALSLVAVVGVAA